MDVLQSQHIISLLKADPFSATCEDIDSKESLTTEAQFLLDQEEAWELYRGADKDAKTDLTNIVEPLYLQLVLHSQLCAFATCAFVRSRVMVHFIIEILT